MGRKINGDLITDCSVQWLDALEEYIGSVIDLYFENKEHDDRYRNADKEEKYMEIKRAALLEITENILKRI